MPFTIIGSLKPSDCLQPYFRYPTMWISVTILTFKGPVWSLLTWSSDLIVVISCKCCNVTSHLFLIVLERMGTKYIGVMTFTFLGDVTSLVTWLVAICQHLYNLISYHQRSRLLRSSSQSLFQVPRVKTDFGRRAFSSAAPQIWNHIPAAIKVSPSLDSFKRHLKTHYFTSP